jgi:hypothetical protein
MSYFEDNERQDLQLLYQFNYDNKLFTWVMPTEPKSQIDAIAMKGDRNFAIEIKHRLIPVNKYKSIMIEDYKYLELMMEKQFNNREPLYINFLHDAVVIFNLNRLKEKPKLRVMNIKSEGYDKVQYQERRYMLDLSDAVIYKDNKLCKKMGEEWKTQQYS